MRAPRSAASKRCCASCSVNCSPGVLLSMSKSRILARGPSRRSILANRPDYVEAIGMISIELANLELSPRAAIGRLTVLENVLDVTLREGRRRARIENLLGAAKAAIGKRNELIHGAWGITADPPIGEVHWHGLPFKDTTRLVKLEELTNLIDSIRGASDETATIADIIYTEWPPYTSRPKRRRRRPSSIKTLTHHRSGAPPKRRRPPRSSRA